MESALASIFISLRDSISGLIFLCVVTIIINIILWVYIVKIRKKELENEDKIKSILYVVRDIQDELKPSEVITDVEDQSDADMKELINKISKK